MPQFNTHARNTNYQTQRPTPTYNKEPEEPMSDYERFKSTQQNGAPTLGLKTTVECGYRICFNYVSRSARFKAKRTFN